MYNPSAMDELEFYEPEEIPQPPDAVKIEALAARVYPDGRRVRLAIKLTPFLERPNVELRITNADGNEVATLSIIETMDAQFEMTAHLRGPQPEGRYTLHGELFYDPEAPHKVAEITFDVPYNPAG
jgi:hypothetical protein